MKKILIIGAGAMGSAFSVPCLDNNNEVILSGTFLEKNLIKKLQNKKVHPSLKAKLSKKLKIIQFDQLSKVLKKKLDFIVIAVSSKGINWTCEQLIKSYSKNIPIIVLTKGLVVHKNKIITLSKKINLIFKNHKLPMQDISSIKGPCLASGLINKVNTSTVIANKNLKTAKNISKMISTPYYKTEVSTDVNGVETAGAIKNIYSMIIGASEGLSGDKLNPNIRKKFYHNTASSLFKNSIKELGSFLEFMNGKYSTAYGLAGLGDLYVSVAGGRNSQLGFYLGKGKLYKNIVKNEMKNITVEGADLSLEIGKFIMKSNKKNKFPILLSLINSICKNRKLKINW